MQAAEQIHLPLEHQKKQVLRFRNLSLVSPPHNQAAFPEIGSRVVVNKLICEVINCRTDVGLITVRKLDDGFEFGVSPSMCEPVEVLIGDRVRLRNGQEFIGQGSNRFTVGVISNISERGYVISNQAYALFEEVEFASAEQAEIETPIPVNWGVLTEHTAPLELPRLQGNPVRFLALVRGKDVPWWGIAISEPSGGFVEVVYHEGDLHHQSLIPERRLLPLEHPLQLGTLCQVQLHSSEVEGVVVPAETNGTHGRCCLLSDPRYVSIEYGDRQFVQVPTEKAIPIPQKEPPQAGWLSRDGTFHVNSEYDTWLATHDAIAQLEQRRRQLLTEDIAPDCCWLESAKCHNRKCKQVFYRSDKPIFGGKKRRYVGMEGSPKVAIAAFAITRRNELERVNRQLQILKKSYH